MIWFERSSSWAMVLFRVSSAEAKDSFVCSGGGGGCFIAAD